MRISDGSSDVCASDLRQSPDEHGSHAAPPRRISRRRDPRPLRAILVFQHETRKIMLLIDRIAQPRRHRRHGLLRPARAPLRYPIIILKLQHIEGRRSEEHTSELQSLMRTSYAVLCLKKKKKPTT